MKNIVITGSTRGIGLALADAFLQRGCRVIINGRAQESVEQTCVDLALRHGSESLFGFLSSGPPVSDPLQVQALWDYAVEHLGAVDIWINNAGLGHDTEPMWQIPTAQMRSVIEVNVLGTLYGIQVAMQGMLKQGFGQIYNLEGFGSNGRTRSGLSVYGTSKAAVHYLTKALIEEAKETGIQIGSLQPGMVMTDLVLDRFEEDPQALDKAKSIFNIIGDKAENVAPWLADHILENTRHGVAIDYMPTSKIVGRFITAPFSKRDLFDDESDPEP